jgi:ribosomal protein L11 methyltransferase
MLGATVTGLDISDVAVEVARENVKTNGFEDRIMVDEGSIEAVRGRQFDLIFANIIASVLIALAPQLAAALERGAPVLASGIVDERVDEVRRAFQAAGLVIEAGRRDADWWLLVARKPA